MSFIVVIPARYASTRLPGKPLRDIAGLPMIQHVWQQAQKSQATRVVIATDDSRIQSAAGEFGAEVCMTRADQGQIEPAPIRQFNSNRPLALILDPRSGAQQTDALKK